MSIVLFRVFFCKWKLLLKLGGRDFLKWKQLFCIGETYFSIFFTRLVRTDFFVQWKQYFFGQCYFTVSRNHYWNKKKTDLRERAHSYQWTTDFLTSGNHFFLHFSETLASDSFFFVQWKRLFQQNPLFALVEKDFLASGNRFLLFRGFSFQWKPSLKLVQKDFSF